MQLDKILPFFAKYIEAELGIIYAEHNYFQLQNRLEEISKLLGLNSVSALYELAQSGIQGQFKQLLLDLSTNNETSFFRDPKAFQAIESFILPEFLKSHSLKTEFRVWSAASSAGQEALSIAILLKEFGLKKGLSFPYSILGTDISDRILARAQSAEYSQLEVQRGLATQLLLKYFKKNDQDRWTANAELRAHTEFKKQNLLDPFFFKKTFHLILCRNVLIYQTVESKKEIINRITALLEPGGVLILGSGESLLGLSSDYIQTSTQEGAILYVKRGLSEAQAA